MIECLKQLYKDGNKSSGRTSRKDFWLTIVGVIACHILFTIVLGLIAGILLQIFGQDNAIAIIILGIFLIAYVIWYFITAWASLMMEIRRLHDINMSGWWMLLCLIGIGNIALLVFFCLPSVDEGNRFGE